MFGRVTLEEYLSSSIELGDQSYKDKSRADIKNEGKKTLSANKNEFLITYKKMRLIQTYPCRLEGKVLRLSDDCSLHVEHDAKYLLALMSYLSEL